MPGESRAVFLSYASEDSDAAQSIAEALKAGGIEVWFDKSELRGGDAWDHKIRQQIQDCALFMPLISPATEARLEGYFRREWRLAADRMLDMAEAKPFLVPVVLGDIAEKDAQVPEYFRRVQWTRLTTGEIPSAFVERISVLLGFGPPENARPGPSFSELPRLTRSATRISRRRRRFAGIVITALLAVGGYVAYHHRLTPSTTAGTEIEKSIAVLPFVDLSETHDQHYFGDGMAEEIIGLLAKIPGLKVIGRTSSFQFKGRNEDLRRIGEMLNASYVLEGSVRTSAGFVRITTQLIRARTGAHEWSQTFDRPIGDVLRLQEEIAAAVGRELQLSVASEYATSRRGANDAGVYELLLRGRHAFDRFDSDGLAEAATLFQRAVDQDPMSADAAAELAFAFEAQGEWGFLTPKVAFERSRSLASHALALDPNNAHAHYVLGYIYTVYDWNWDAARQEFLKVAALAPSGADALIGEALIARTTGRWDDALGLIRAALNQDPLSPDGLSVLMRIHWNRGHLSEAEACARRVLEIRPTYGDGHYFLGLILLARGDRDAALLEMQKETVDDAREGGLAMATFALGRRSESDSMLSRMLREQGNRNAFGIAEVYAFRGQPDEAMNWLERAYTQKDPSLYFTTADPPLKSLASDIRFKALLRRMNLFE